MHTERSGGHKKYASPLQGAASGADKHYKTDMFYSFTLLIFKIYFHQHKELENHEKNVKPNLS